MRFGVPDLTPRLVLASVLASLLEAGLWPTAHDDRESTPLRSRDRGPPCDHRRGTGSDTGGRVGPLVDTIRASADLSSLATNVSALFDMFSRIIHAGLTDELAGFVTWLKQQLTVAMRLSLTIP